MLGVTGMQGFQLAQFSLVSSLCKTDGAEGSTVFGIKGSYGVRDQYVLEDISANKEHVETLLRLLRQHQVSPDQLGYVVEDYIAML